MRPFYSLFNVSINWQLFAVVSIIIWMLFPEMSVYSYFAILITLHQFFLMFNSIGNIIPVRYLFGSFMCLQMLLGPMLAYNGLDKYQLSQYKMQIPEDVYFVYVIPAVIAFILGLHINAGKLKGEVINASAIERFVRQHKNMPYFFIGIGFIASILSGFFSSEFAFLFFLMGGFKFIGAFMIIVGNQQLKIIPLLIVYGSILASSLGIGMFHDLLTWIIFLGYVFALKHKPGVNIKRLVVFSFLIMTLVIQQLKGGYRSATWQKGEETGFATLNKVYEAGQENKSLFNYQSLAASNVRFNQGFIITNIMTTVPSKIPHADGKELIQILEAAFMPRILAPNKLNAGDRELFMKYSGMRIAKSTSMGLSSVGDAYINFGVVGGCIFMFFLGLLYNLVLKGFYKYSKAYPALLLFTPLVFYYPIRPDCELQTILGHLVKSCFLIFVIFQVWKKYFIVYPYSPEKDIHTDPLVPSRL